jgi:hypothetical protein
MASAVLLLGLTTGPTPPAGAGPRNVRLATNSTCPATTIVAGGAWSGPAPPGPLTTAGSIDAPIPAATTSPSFDMDGDGTPDAVATQPNGDVAIVRQDGIVTLTSLPFGLTLSAGTAADLDGDSKDELWGSFRTPGSNGYQATLVVPGTTPVGSHTIASVSLMYRGTVVGDVTGDDRDDAAEQVPINVITPSPTYTRYRSFGGALAGTGPFAFPTGLTLVSNIADLDFDGKPDRLLASHGTADGGDGTSAVALSTGGAAIPLVATNGATTFATVDAVRSGTQTFLIGNWSGLGTHLIFEVRGACANAWINSATQVLDHRFATPADLGPIAPTLDPDRSQRRARVSTLLHTSEARTVLIGAAYGSLLERKPDAGGRTYWLNAITSGRKTYGMMLAGLLGSAENYRKWGATHDSWIEHVYEVFLGRRPDASGRAYWTHQIALHGRARTAVRLTADRGIRAGYVRATASSVYVLGDSPDDATVRRIVDAMVTGGYDAAYVELLSLDAQYVKSQRDFHAVPA